MSCTTEELPLVKPNGMSYEEASKPKDPVYSTFTIIWESNQEGAYVELNKMHFKDCKLTIISTENIREHKFEVTLEHGQPFDIQIKRQASVQNPELYLAIYKGNELQYEQETNSNGFLLSTFVDGYGNIKN